MNKKNIEEKFGFVCKNCLSEKNTKLEKAFDTVYIKCDECGSQVVLE